MKEYLPPAACLLPALMLGGLLACESQSSVPSQAAISQLNLKRGPLISCGAPTQEFGSVNFELSGSEQTQQNFNLAVKLLHSFEYDEAEKVFARIITENPACAQAYWGVAMCNFHPLWTPPTAAELQKGSRVLAAARSIEKKTSKESAYLNAIGAFYQDWPRTDHRSRCLSYEKAMAQLHRSYPDDQEIAVFYALALAAAASPSDKTYANQKKAGALLTALYPAEPNHPGIIHYLIHTYDYPGLATLALPAARKYARVAPSSAHALHMPSHVFTRLGLWDECIKSNLAAAAAAKCYAGQAGLKGHWDEELHSLDYLVYAYLQQGDNARAHAQLRYLEAMRDVEPVNFKVAYAFAAAPARFALENKDWPAAAALAPRPNFPWADYPWQESIRHFARLLGAAQLGRRAAAQAELARLNQLHATLLQQKDSYKAQQVAIQLKTGEAWLQLAAGQDQAALATMQQAAELEDSTEKHPVTPGEVLPARELLADMLLRLKHYPEALLAYEAVLHKAPNRFNSLYGAGLAAEKAGMQSQASSYYQQLVSTVGPVASPRPELAAARVFLDKRF